MNTLNKRKIRIVTSACFLDDRAAQDFLDWNKDVFETHDVEITIVSDRMIELKGDRVRCLKYPAKQDVFSIPRTINYGIRRVEEEGIVVKTDVDILFSSELLEQIKEKVNDGQGLIAICVDIDKPEYATRLDWNRLPKTSRREGRGACFAMTRHDWFRLKGYDERITGWGADDEEMWRRASKVINMIQTDRFPIYHIRHNERKGLSHFPVRSEQNLKFAEKQDWNMENWGQKL